MVAPARSAFFPERDGRLVRHAFGILTVWPRARDSARKRMNTKEIRKKFLDYFVSKRHALVASSPLVPAGWKSARTCAR